MAIIKETYPLLGMECASCIRQIEANLGKTDGVKSATVNLATEKIIIEYDNEKIDVKKLEKILGNLGYELIA